MKYNLPISNGKFLPSQTEFLEGLSNCSEDLKRFVELMRSGRASFEKYLEFTRAPLTKQADGTLKFGVFENFNQNENLLELANSPTDITGLLASEQFAVYEMNNDRNRLLTPQYDGPKLFIYPDTNIALNREIDVTISLMARSHPGIVKDMLTVVQAERKPQGIEKIFNSNLPQSIFRGQETLEKRLFDLSKDERSSLETFYDCVRDYFNQEMGIIFSMADLNPRASATDVATKIANSKKSKNKLFVDEDNYKRMVSKIIEKHRESKDYNLVADRVLAATCFGMNLLSPRNRGVVVSNDSDLITMFDTFYNEILPLYVARITLDTMKNRPSFFLSLPRCEERTVQAAREHIEWSKSQSLKKISAGVLYVPNEKAFYIQQVSDAFGEFFKGIGDYRHGKTQMVSQMVITGKRAADVFRSLACKKGYNVFL